MGRRGRPPAGKIPEPKQAVEWSLTLSSRNGAHWSISKACMQQLSWLAIEPDEEPADVAIYFWLGDPGHADAFPATDFYEDINRRLDDLSGRDHAKDIWLTVQNGAFLRKTGVLRIPEPVVAHVTRDVTERTPFWLYASADTLQLWSEERRSQTASAAGMRLRRASDGPFSGT